MPSADSDWRRIALLALLWTGFAVFGSSVVLIPSQRCDEWRFMELIISGPNYYFFSKGDNFTAALYKSLALFGFYTVVPKACLIVSMTYFSARFRDGVALASLGILAFPLFIQLRYVSKEGVLAVLALALIAVFLLVRDRIVRYAIVLAILLVLGAWFRQYYLISAAMLAVLFIAGRARGFSILALATPAVLLIPSVAHTLYNARHKVLSYAIKDGVRSVLYLPFDQESVSHIIGNYALATVQLLFPALFSWDPRELALQAYVALVAILVVLALRRGSRPALDLFLAIVLVLPLFIADFGTFLRHLSAAVPLLWLSLALPDRLRSGRVP